MKQWVRQTKATHIFIFCLAVFICMTISLFSLDPEKEVHNFITQRWTSEDGLPNSTIRTILQTRDGYLWLGTYGGLSRFDGVRFKTFTKNNTPEIGHNTINCLHEDDNGVLWIGSYSGLIRYYHGEFKNFSDKDGLSNSRVFHICRDTVGNLWVGTVKGLNCMKNDRIKAYYREDGLEGNYITALAPDNDGGLWIGTNFGLNHFKNNKFTLYTTKDGLSSDKIYMLTQGKNGELWIGTRNDGIMRYQDNKFEIIKREGSVNSVEQQEPSLHGQLSSDRIRTIYVDKHNIPWIGTSADGLNRIRKDTIEYLPMEEDGEIRSIRSICEDREGSIWLGTFHGLYCLKEEKFMFINRKNGLPTDTIRNIMETPDGTILIGTYGKGVLKLKDGKLQQVPFMDRVKYNQVFSVLHSRDGAIWTGTNGGGLLCLKEGKTTVYDRNNGFPDNVVRAVFQDSNGTIWVGTDGSGIALIRDGKVIKTYNHLSGLANDKVFAIAEDSKGSIWIGARRGGITRYKDGKFSILGLDAGFEDVTIWSIYADQEGNIWFGTNGQGLVCYKNDVFTFINMKSGLYDDVAFQVVEDHHQQLWMNSNQGIYMARKQDLLAFTAGSLQQFSSTSYGKNVGITLTEAPGPALPGAWVGKDGKVWFAARKGIAIFDPGNIPENRIIPTVIIESLTIDQQKHSPYQITMIPPGSRDLQIRYTALSFKQPQLVRFKYRLQGYDEDWVPAGTRRVAYYTNLSPRAYTFQVIACNNDGLWNEEGATLSFYMEPFFYQTAWFLALCGVVILLMGFIAYRFRVRALRQKQLKLQKLVAEQTAHLKDRTDELETMNTIVTIINQAIDLDSVLKAMLKQAMHLVPSAEKALFFIYDHEIECFTVAASEGYDSSVLQNLQLTYEEASGRYCQEETDSETPVHILRNQKGLSDSDKFKELPCSKAMLIMEVSPQSQVEGILLLDNFSTPDAFDKTDVEKITRFRKHAVSAILKAGYLKQLETEKEKAEKANKAKSSFLASMSHEIRTPMNAILGFSQLLKTKIHDPQLKEYLSAVSVSGKTLLQLINDILDLSKIEAGKLTLHYEPVDPHTVFYEIKQMFSPKIIEKDLDLRINIVSALPAALMLDAVRIRQVLFNLVGNALKFTGKGYVEISVSCENIREEQNLVDFIFSVTDTGIGIPLDQQALIFKAFRQQNGQKIHQYGGSGLGLAITRRLIQLMKGEITLKSKPGKGSTFTVHLKDIEIAAAPPVEEIRENTLWKSADFKGADILVVDDILYNRRLVKGFLDSHHVTVREAQNGQEAIDYARKQPPHLVLMDMKMDVMDGYQATKLIKTDPQLKKIPVIALTASIMLENEKTILKTGCDAILRKPIGNRELVETLMEFLPYNTGQENQQVTVEEFPTARLPQQELMGRLPQLLDTIETQLIPKWNRINEIFILHEVEAFVEMINILGREYPFDILVRWGKLLEKEYMAFDINRLEVELNHLPQLIEDLKALAVTG